MTPQRDGFDASGSIEPRGFSGLAALVSSIDVETLRTSSVVPKKASATGGLRARSSLIGNQQPPQRQDPQTPPPLRDRSAGKRLLGIGAVAALVIFVASLSSTSSSSSYESSTPFDTGFAMTDPVADQPAETAPATADDVASESSAPQAETGTESLDDRTRDRLRARAEQGNNGLKQDELSNPVDKYLQDDPARGTDVTDTYESKPMAGRNSVLGSSEIRYCLSEEIRLKGAEKVIDERESSQIDRFNQLVDDYNYRCSSYRYNAGTRQRVLSQVEVRRAQLEAEGAAQFR